MSKVVGLLRADCVFGAPEVHVDEACLGHEAQQFMMYPDARHAEDLQEADEEILLIGRGEACVEWSGDEPDGFEDDLDEREDSDRADMELDSVFVTPLQVELRGVFFFGEEPNGDRVRSDGLDEADGEEHEVVGQEVVNRHELQVEIVELENLDLAAVNV